VSSSISLSINSNLATIEIARPEKRNSLTPEMLNDFESVLIKLRAEKSVQFVVITGSGDKAFCTGADLNTFVNYQPSEVREDWIPGGHRIFQRLFDLPQITIARINGDTFGGGLELALSCDLRISRSDARFGLPENRVGTMPGWNGFKRLVEVSGLARAKELILTGESISAEQAYSWHIVNRVCDYANLDSEIEDVLTQLSKSAPIAQRISKQILNSFQNLQNGLILESLGGALTHTTKDFHEGVKAFKEKRPSKFKGE